MFFLNKFVLWQQLQFGRYQEFSLINFLQCANSSTFYIFLSSLSLHPGSSGAAAAALNINLITLRDHHEKFLEQR